MGALFIPLLVVHVTVAVLGLGSILSVALTARAARGTDGAARHAQAWLGRLLRCSGLSLAAMLVTGALMDVVTGGAFRDWWWFRASALLLVATGGLHGWARRTLRADPHSGDGRDTALRRLERISYGMCVLIAAITVLMQAKPF